jgi:hypothetical protein
MKEFWARTNQPVLVPDALGLELGLVLGREDLLEDVLEPAVVLLEDRAKDAQRQVS